MTHYTFTFQSTNINKSNDNYSAIILLVLWTFKIKWLETWTQVYWEYLKMTPENSIDLCRIALYVNIIGHQKVIKVSELRLSTFFNWVSLVLMAWHFSDLSKWKITKSSSWVDQIDTMNAIDWISFLSKF